jgi:hypothetical protein
MLDSLWGDPQLVARLVMTLTPRLQNLTVLIGRDLVQAIQLRFSEQVLLKIKLTLR